MNPIIYIAGEAATAGEESAFKVVCYYGAWAVYRPEPMNVKVADIDPFACTHLIYSFAGLDNQTWEIVSLDPELDIVQGKVHIGGLHRINYNLNYPCRTLPHCHPFERNKSQPSRYDRYWRLE